MKVKRFFKNGGLEAVIGFGYLALAAFSFYSAKKLSSQGDAGEVDDDFDFSEGEA